MATTQPETPNNNNNIIPFATIDNARAMINEVLVQLTPYIPNITPEEIKHSRNVSDKSMEIVEKAENFAEQNPKTVSPVLNVTEWADELQAIVDIHQLKNLSEQLTTAISRYELRFEIDAMENFIIYYRTIKTLIKEGYTLAIPIYDELKKMYIKNFGKKPEGETIAFTEEEKIAMSEKIKPARHMIASNKHILEGKKILILDDSDKI